MRITRRQLRRSIIETMISPSNLIDQILNDPQVDDGIKNMLRFDDIESHRQGLELAGLLYPEYDQGGLDHAYLASKDYQKKFTKASRSYMIAYQQLGSLMSKYPIDYYVNHDHDPDSDNFGGLKVVVTAKDPQVLDQIEEELLGMGYKIIIIKGDPSYGEDDTPLSKITMTGYDTNRWRSSFAHPSPPGGRI